MTDPAAPRRIAVVVTAYNYGHFLSACLDGVLEQTRPADEIVVIDDGSTDDTAAVLARYADRVRVVACKNGGQAAAFNRGFAETSAELILFLDADDLLHPHALETVLLHWSADMASLVFDLEMIDAGGASLGLNPSLGHGPGHGPLPDNRPGVLVRGSYPFPPTSGNVFGRAFLAAALPMPEARWRISADCWLVRAAALFGRTGVVRRVLGGYRIHFANNYARLGAGGWDKGLRLANRADVIGALRGLAEAPDALLGQEAERVRAALATRADLIERHGDAHADQPFERFADLLRPRWPPIVAPDRPHLLAASPEIAASCRLTGQAAALVLRLPQATGPLSVELELEPACDAGIEVFADGRRAAELRPHERHASVSLPRAPFDPDRRVHIVARARGDGPPPALRTVEVGTGRTRRHAPLLRPVPEPAFATLGAGLEAGAWRPAPGGGAALACERGRLHLSAPRPGPARLVLDLAAPVPAGRLTIEADGAPAFHGRTGSAARIAATLPLREAVETQVTIRFEPDEGEAPPPLVLATVALRPLGPDPGRLPVSLGETVAFLAHPLAAHAFGAGWFTEGATGPQTAAAEATLSLDVDPDAQDLTVTLRVAPLFPPPEGHALVLGVSHGETMLAQAHLLGAGDFAVPVGPAPANGRLDLVLHSVLIAGDEVEFAPVELTEIEIGGRLAFSARPPALPAARAPGFQRALDRAGALLADPDAPHLTGELAACRAALVSLVARSDVALPLLLLGSEHQARLLVDLAEATRGEPATDEERAALDGLSGAESDRGRLAHALAGLLLVPAWRHPFGGDLARLPVPFLASPEAIGAWLGAAPDLETEADHDAWRGYLGRLLASALAALEEGPTLGRRHALAAATVRQLRATRMIFGAADVTALARLQSRAIERVLADAGADLTAPPTIRAGLDRLRLGVLVRDVTPTPEGWALRGMYDGLDTARFEPVLIRMSDEGDPAPDVFARTLCLAGLSTDEAVAAIRALELDIFVAGAYARDFEPVTAIYAHRLAPLQVWHTAVCPTTSGLSSFDAALTCPATEPEDAQAQYHEPLHEIPGAAPCAYAFPPPERADGARLRADLALGEGQAMLISAAMAHKITDRVLAAWAQVLEQVPEAVLVLAPFAANWSMPADPARFAARLAAAGLPPERVTICPAMPPARLRALVAAADLMLDSFPYSGATTVCEALSVGTPVVARAGDALRQLTGAGWLRAHGMADLVAGDDAAYIAIAARLARDPAARVDAARRTAGAAAGDPPPHDDRAGYGAAYAQALRALADASGRFPGLAPARAEAGPFRPSSTPPAPALALRPTRARMLAILASPRTGSTLLCAVLNRTPGVLCHFELFHEEMIQYARETVDAPHALAERDADPAGFLERVREEAGAAGLQLAAFKHFAHLDQTVTRRIAEDPDTALIHLSRENLLAQYSSEQIARASGEWARHTDRTGEQLRVPFDAAEFEHFLEYQQRIEMERMNIFGEMGRTPLFVEYTRLSDRHTRARIGAHVGITIPDSAQPDIRKQNSTDILSRFSNPQAVEEFLARRYLSRWAREA